MAEVDIETRVPASIAHDLVVGQVMDFIDRMAEAGRTYQGAVSATQASRGNVVPMGMIESIEQSVSDPVSVDSARDLFAGAMSPLLTGLRFVGESDSFLDGISRFAPGIGTDGEQETVFDFGECKIESFLAFGTGSHGGAEACRGGLCAIDGNYEQLTAPKSIDGILVFVAKEDLVLDRDRSEFARSDPEKCVASVLDRWRFHRPAGGSALRPHDFREWRKEILFPGVRSHIEPEMFFI